MARVPVPCNHDPNKHADGERGDFHNGIFDARNQPVPVRFDIHGLLEREEQDRRNDKADWHEHDQGVEGKPGDGTRLVGRHCGSIHPGNQLSSNGTFNVKAARPPLVGARTISRPLCRCCFDPHRSLLKKEVVRFRSEHASQILTKPQVLSEPELPLMQLIGHQRVGTTRHQPLRAIERESPS